MDYRQRMRELRKGRNLSQLEVGRALFRSQQGYSHLENGKAELSIRDLIALSKLYEVSVDYIVGETDDPKASWLESPIGENLDEN